MKRILRGLLITVKVCLIIYVSLIVGFALFEKRYEFAITSVIVLVILFFIGNKKNTHEGDGKPKIEYVHTRKQIFFHSIISAVLFVIFIACISNSSYFLAVFVLILFAFAFPDIRDKAQVEAENEKRKQKELEKKLNKTQEEPEIFNKKKDKIFFKYANEGALENIAMIVLNYQDDGIDGYDEADKKRKIFYFTHILGNIYKSSTGKKLDIEKFNKFLESQKPPIGYTTTTFISDEWIDGLNDTINFSYEDNHGNTTFRTVRVYSANSYYFKGYCYSRKDERTFKYTSIIGDVIRSTTGEVITPDKWRNQLIASRIETASAPIYFEETPSASYKIKDYSEELEERGVSTLYDESYFVDDDGRFRLPKYEHRKEYKIRIKDNTDYKRVLRDNALPMSVIKDFTIKDFEHYFEFEIEIKAEPFWASFSRFTKEDLEPYEFLYNKGAELEAFFSESVVFDSEEKFVLEGIAELLHQEELVDILDSYEDKVEAMEIRFTVPELKEIAKANSIKITGKKKADLIEEILQLETFSPPVLGQVNDGFKKMMKYLYDYVYFWDIKENLERFHPLYKLELLKELEIDNYDIRRYLLTEA